MHNARIYFEILDHYHHVQVVWKKFTGHMVFDVKIDFTRKASWVLYEHRILEPEVSLYAGVVSRESIRITIICAEFNGINVVATEIRNTYLQAPSS